MCQSFTLMVVVPSVIQSLVWTGLGIAGVLLYQGVLTVSSYKDQADFFVVTLVKLYFEGPQWTLDGAYLGKFNKDYKDSSKFPRILTPSLIFTVMVLYIIFCIMHFIFSFQLYKNRKVRTAKDRKKLLRVIKEWSVLSLIISVLDAFLTAGFIFDFSSLMAYINREIQNPEEQSKLFYINYIPLTMALLSSRFIVLWILNVVIGAILFINAFCRSKIIGLPPLKEEEPEEKQEVQSSPQEKKPPELSLKLDSKWDKISLKGDPKFGDSSLDHYFESGKNNFSRDYENPTKTTNSMDYSEKAPHFRDYSEKPPYFRDYSEKPPHFRDYYEKPPYFRDYSEKAPDTRDYSEKPPHFRDYSEKPPYFRDYSEKAPDTRDYSEKPPHFRDYPEKAPHLREYPVKTSQFREKRHLLEGNDQRNYYEQKSALWYPPHLSQSRKQEDWGVMNDAYVKEEQGPTDLEKSLDFEHNLKNFEQGNKKIKIRKPPLGKPVSIPVPPPLPQNEVYNC